MYIRATSHILHSSQYFWIWTLVIRVTSSNILNSKFTLLVNILYFLYRAVFRFSKSYTNCLQRKAIRTFDAIHVVLTKTPSNFLELKKTSMDSTRPRIASWGVWRGLQQRVSLNTLNIEDWTFWTFLEPKKFQWIPLDPELPMASTWSVCSSGESPLNILNIEPWTFWTFLNHKYFNGFHWT